MPYASSLDGAAREERNRYYREYRAKNKEKIKAIQRRYWEKKATESKNKGKVDHDEQGE